MTRGNRTFVRIMAGIIIVALIATLVAALVAGTSDDNGLGALDTAAVVAVPGTDSH